MKRVAIIALTALVIGMFLLTGCLVWKSEVEERDAQITQLQAQITQLQAEKQQWEEVDKPALENEVTTLEDELAELQNLRVLTPSPQDPTYSALMDFVAQDETNSLVLGGVETYGMVFLARAKEAGIKAYLVRVTVVGPPQRYWYFTAFNTTDQGLVYIFSFSVFEGEVRLEVGKKYEALNEYPFAFGIDDTILKIELFE
jgi:outer membrane murein-binding lipoprotein Lpp